MLVLQVPHIQNQFIGKILKNMIENYAFKAILTYVYYVPICQLSHLDLLDNGTIMEECFHTDRIPLARGLV